MGSANLKHGTFYCRVNLEVTSQFVRSSARDVLAAVNTAVAEFGTKTITVVGHSLGKSSVTPWWVKSLSATLRRRHLPHRRPLFKDQRARQYR